MGDIIKVEVELHRQFFPKDEKIKTGDFGIVAWRVLNVIEGNPEIHPYFHTITVKGTMCEINAFETYTIVGRESPSDRGMQYDLLYIGQPTNLTDIRDQKIFLSRILTEKQVEEMFKVLDNPIQSIAEGRVSELTKVKGIGEATAFKIMEKYELTKEYSDIYVKLADYNLTDKMIDRLINRYKSPDVVVSKITENPYVLATEVDGIGFLTADKIALEKGLDWDSLERVQAFILHRLEQEAQQGHSYVCASNLMYDIWESLGYEISNEKIGMAVNKSIEEKRVGVDVAKGNKRVYLTKYKRLEQRVCDELLRLLDGRSEFTSSDWKEKVKHLEEMQGWEHTEEQWSGIETVLNNQVVMITGFGGTGKSSIVRAMLEALEHSRGKYSFAQTALSGRASAKLQEVTGQDGQTIHRLLKYSPFEGFVHNENNQLGHDLVVLDEVSLVGGEIFLSLIKAIKTGAKLILLGDDAQLESIGCMNLAKDLINSKTIPTVTLTQIHRQAKKSGIITESIKMRTGEQSIDFSFSGLQVKGELEDFVYDISIDKENIRDRILEHFKEWYNKLKDIMDVQVIVPVKTRGDCSVEKVNTEIQSFYNPKDDLKQELEVITNKDRNEGYTLREKDKVMIMKNNYKIENEDGEEVGVFNGWVGIVEEINLNEKMIYISLPIIKDTVLIPFKDRHIVQLGYANTTHKFQGSSSKVIIGGLDYSTPPLMRTRELIYTLVTRAEKHCILVAQNGALRESVETSFVSDKNTFLREMLDNEI